MSEGTRESTQVLLALPLTFNHLTTLLVTLEQQEVAIMAIQGNSLEEEEEEDYQIVEW